MTLYNQSLRESSLSTNQSRRQSNIEALRIIAMFLVLIVHANFSTFKMPTSYSTQDSPLLSFLQIWTEALSLVCVNVFILISGYFKISLCLKKICAFTFQIVFYLLGINFVLTFFGGLQFSIRNFIPYIPHGWWFVYEYIILMFFSPILNIFVKSVSQKQLGIFIIIFYSVEFLFGWLTKQVPMFCGGYSAVSFIGLYLTGRYINLYPTRFSSINKKYYIIIYMLCTLLSTCILFIVLHRQCSDNFTKKVLDYFISYVSPQTILGSICLLLFFTRIKFYSKIINWIAMSSFAVYLIHANQLVFPYFTNAVKYLNNKYGEISFLLTTVLFLIVIFISSTIIDKIRIFLWNKLWNKMHMPNIYFETPNSKDIT